MTGLFHKAISQSGQALNSDAVHQPGEARALAWQLGNIVSCNTSTLKTSEDLVTCLREIPAEELAKACFKMMVSINLSKVGTYWNRSLCPNSRHCSLLQHDYILPFMLFGPVLENNNIKGAFLVEDPCLSVQRSNEIPWMIGAVPDEGSQRVLSNKFVL